MISTIIASIKKQRLVWSWALIVGLFLVLLGHAPIFPVILGGALAITIVTLRSSSKINIRPTFTRGGR